MTRFSIPQEVNNLFDLFEKSGKRLYLVGGAVRNMLLGKMVYDWDFTTDATPEETLEILKAKEPFYNNKFGTVGVPSQEYRPHEITTFRSEQGYSDNRRPDNVVWGKTIEEDLQRRDFTINAIALKKDPASKNGFEIIDPFNGQGDIKNKLVRTVGEPNERFSEDALRLMRAVRFATELDFNIEDGTFEAIKQNAIKINAIAKERVRDELLKIIASPNAYRGMEVFRNTGLMQEVLPELEKTFGVEQKSPGRHHIHDVGTHSLLSLKNVPSQDVITRFATLIHDIGKPQTFKRLETGTITFYNHEVVGATIAKRIAERLRFSRKDTGKLIRLVRWHQFTVNENQSDKALRRFIRNTTLEYVDDMLALRTGDRLGGGATETSWRLEEFKKRIVEVQKQPFTVRDLQIDGLDVMNTLKLHPGPQVGEILNRLYNEVTEGDLPNQKEDLLKRLEYLRPQVS